MKKLAYILFTFLLASTIWSCGSLKLVKETNKETTTTEKKEVTKDSISKIETSKPIKDNIVINVPKSENEAVNKALDAILEQLNTSKVSGSNSYVSRYDAETNKLLIEFLIGQTQNQTTSTNSDTKTEKTFEEKTDEYISKKIKAIPWWFYALVVFWFFPQILKRVQAVINPLSGLLK